MGIFGGWLLATAKLGFNSANYLSVTREFLEMDDLVMSLVKAGVFGFAIGLMGCYNGFTSNGGAAGVGRATTNAVVSAFRSEERRVGTGCVSTCRSRWSQEH